MKTKLLLLLLVVTSFVNAQIIFSNDFESTTIPAGWDYGSFTPNTTEFCAGARTLAVTLSPGTQAEIRSPLYAYGNVFYFLYANFKQTANINVSLQFSFNDITWQNVVSSANSSCTDLIGNMGPGFAAIGTNVRYRVLVENSLATSVTTYVDEFKLTGQEVNYTFNNTRNNSNTFQPFSTPNTSFISDRNAVPNNALSIAASAAGTSVTSFNTWQLPSGNSPRTVSFWYKVGSNVSNTSIFAYGPAGAATRFGMYIQGTGRPVFWAGLADPVFGTGSFAADTWHHAVLTYDGANISIYMNGALQATKAFALNTTFGALTFFNGSTSLGLDDLKIYNYAVSQTEVTNLYNYNSLTNPLSVSNINSTSVTTNSASINYTLNTNNPSTTSTVKYGQTSGNLTSSATGFNASSNPTTPGTISITGLLPNTQYFYKVEATNSNGTVTSTESSFTTLANPMSTIAEYNFNNTYNNILGSRPFTANTGTSFTEDRNGNANSALNLVSIGTTAVIPNLPYNSDSRTISVWVKNYSYNWFVASACPFSYGSTTSNTYELAIYETSFTLNPYSNPHAVDLTALSITNALNTWNHYVVSYNGTTSKIYKDGVLLSTINIAITPTTNNSDIFKLGLLNGFTSQYFDGAIDDLKIYNYALSDAEVANLFTNNTLTSQNFNQNSLEASLYPNPVQDMLNIVMSSDIQNVEIYTLQGQKVMQSNQKQINISDLASGIYMIKIQDAENAIATKKFIKE